MLQQPKNISKIVTLLKKEVKRFVNPIVTEIGEETRSPFMVLISCLLSLRTQDKTTGPVAKRFFEVAKTPKEIAENNKASQLLHYKVKKNQRNSKNNNW